MPVCLCCSLHHTGYQLILGKLIHLPVTSSQDLGIEFHSVILMFVAGSTDL